MTDTRPAALWEPNPGDAEGSAMVRFARWVRTERRVDLPSDTDYRDLHSWSVEDIGTFWSSVAEFSGVRWHDRSQSVLGARDMPGAQWFPGATLNYAEHALTPGPGRQDDDVAVTFVREDEPPCRVTHRELRDLVSRARAGLVVAGVQSGERVAALAPNSIETLAMFLAAASLGAVWSSCSPDFGPRAVLDRFAQIEPTVLLAVDGYRYGGKLFNTAPTISALQQQLPTLRCTVVVAYLDLPDPLPGTTSWASFTAETGPLAFTPVPFEHPLWVLYSSGTTGLPKGIVHSHGGILLEHLKVLRLHHDLGPGHRFFWFTTTGWMMWNFLIGGLLVGAEIVLYDGNPGYPTLDRLWELAAEHRISVLGVSASFLQSCLKAGLRPGEEHDLSALRAVGSTGSPLSVEGFQWVAENVGAHVQVCSVSGGTDMCTAFLTSAPTVPVWLGELSVAALGADVHSWDPDGQDIISDSAVDVGELVITQPMPSMPVRFWNDPDGQRLREAYHLHYPGQWRHGDWIRATPHGSFVIYGRSDSTLNRGGIRMGTADFYTVVEGFDEIIDSLVIDTTRLAASDEGALLCFVVLAPSASLEDVRPQLRTALRRELSPRHVPDQVVAVPSIPRTINGKKCEVPIRKILAGVKPDQAVSTDALLDPTALDPFIAMAAGPDAAAE